MREQSIQVAQKAAFDILARCLYNSGIKEFVNIMIEIFEKDIGTGTKTPLVKSFLEAILANQDGE